MPNTTDNKTWNVAVLNIDWRADRHEESHCIEFERPTENNPRPKFPVVVGEVLSDDRLPMSSSWRHLFATVVVKAFDEESLTVQYGKREITVRAGEPWVKLGENGMDYTTFWLFLGLRYVEPKQADPEALTVTHDEQFLYRFRLRERVLRLTDDDVELLRKQADEGDVFAQYGLGRWLYYKQPTETAMSEAEALFVESKNNVPDALAAYALMWRYGETKENVMDLEKSNKLLGKALHRGSERAAQQMARFRIFGQFCEAEPETVAKEIEQRLEGDKHADAYWNVLLAYAYETLDRKDEAAEQYDEAIRKGNVESYYDLALIYKERGNMALYDSLMEEGVKKGSASCCSHRSDMLEEDFQQLSADEQQQLHEQLSAQFEKGLAKGDGFCAYHLWANYYCETLGFPEDTLKGAQYLKRGARLGEVNCMKQIATLHSDQEWPEEMSRTERYELWLRVARYLPDDKEALYRLKYCNDEAFLLRHKDELERYWKPQWEKYVTDEEQYPVKKKPEKTAIDPMVIVIWPTGHMDIEKVDVSKIPSYREMARQLIGADGLDAVHYSSLLHIIGEAAGLEQDLVMYVDRDAQMKQLADNAIGTMLYGSGEVRGPIIICLQDQTHDCHSFTTLEDLTATYNEINSHCNGLLIIKDEDDGRFDAYV